MITQPDNATTCLEGTVVFTCVIYIQNVSISMENIRWWRKREDNSETAMVSSNFRRYNITNNDSELQLTSVLTITNVRVVDLGPYWLGLTAKEQRLCNNAFLSIVPNGMYMRT